MTAHAKNPVLAIFGNPPKGWKKIASNVQAIVYIHAKDRRPYVHAFGGHEPTQEELDSGNLDIGAMPERTKVEAYYSPDGKSVLLRHADGKTLVGLY